MLDWNFVSLSVPKVLILYQSFSLFFAFAPLSRRMGLSEFKLRLYSLPVGRCDMKLVIVLFLDWIVRVEVAIVECWLVSYSAWSLMLLQTSIFVGSFWIGCLIEVVMANWMKVVRSFGVELPMKIGIAGLYCCLGVRVEVYLQRLEDCC